jgi:hypothetical protein
MRPIRLADYKRFFDIAGMAALLTLAAVWLGMGAVATREGKRCLAELFNDQ